MTQISQRPGWFTRQRYGSPGAIVGSVIAFCALVLLAGFTMLMGAAFVMGSDNCFDGDSRLICSQHGQLLSTYLPLGGAFLGVLAGLAGTALGRPVRVPGLAAGYLLTVAGLIAGWLIAAAGS